MSFMLKGILQGRVHCRVVSALDTTLQMEGSKLSCFVDTELLSVSLHLKLTLRNAEVCQSRLNC